MNPAGVDMVLRLGADITVLGAGLFLIDSARKGLLIPIAPYVVKTADATAARRTALVFRNVVLGVGLFLIIAASNCLLHLAMTSALSKVEERPANQGVPATRSECSAPVQLLENDTEKRSSKPASSANFAKVRPSNMSSVDVKPATICPHILENSLSLSDSSNSSLSAPTF